eukprot:TRINITY_DN2839_c0_g2_i1.p1 TRINITY_DN2839_c0_g2~~TRINITY_DN2839_c0_g2_i1.p1  ORF type:complete len:281 (+),score=102.16 TRINITY_DN2839_c0_g2_i1:1022-1864(+)
MRSKPRTENAISPPRNFKAMSYSKVLPHQTQIEKKQELEAIRGRVAGLQKEVGKLRSKLGARVGYENVVDLENKIREADMIYEKYSREYQGLETLKVKQEKDLDTLMKSKESTENIEELNIKLREVKEKNKELEKRIQADTANYQKQHESFVNLQERLQKIRDMKRAWKSALADGVPPPTDDSPQKKKSEEEMLRNTITLIRKKMNFEASAHRKHIEFTRAEIAQLERSIKEIEQENKLNAAKIKELRPLVKHKQLIPLGQDTKADASQSPQPVTTRLMS